MKRLHTPVPATLFVGSGVNPLPFELGETTVVPSAGESCTFIIGENRYVGTPIQVSVEYEPQKYARIYVPCIHKGEPV